MEWFTQMFMAMEESLHDVPLIRKFTRLNWQQRLPDETILQFLRLVENQMLAPDPGAGNEMVDCRRRGAARRLGYQRHVDCSLRFKQLR